MTNRLGRETSPYLRQHADNPVHWQTWNEAALAQARAEDKPILLSIGYSTCHWCHVMARESFENTETAALMNRLYVNVKVDREERPDLDHIYQSALQMLTGRAGGWPLTMFLMPDGTPFFGGTYFPPQARHGLPAFSHVLEQVARAYHAQRDDIAQQNASLRAALARVPAAAAALPDVDLCRQALADIRQGFDPEHGGFSAPPKFPRPAELDFLFWSGDADARREVLFTLERMAAHGLMDQLGGGFFRYSVDARWRIPHFEKMLYDNGLLLALYADAWAATGNPLFARAADGIVEWLAREMTAPEGLFYSALDADSEHEEGRFYLWTPEQAMALLTPEEYRVAAAYWGLDGAANFEHYAWHLGEARPLAEVAAARECPLAAAERLLASARAKLLAARAERARPGLDDKCLTAWNALTIKGLARAARRFDRADWLALARTACDALWRQAWHDGRLAASFQAGSACHNGTQVERLPVPSTTSPPLGAARTTFPSREHSFLDDHAFLLDALLELMQAGWRGEDTARAMMLADSLLTRFEDHEHGGFFFTSHDHEPLIQRPKPAHDQAMPAGNGIAALALGRLGLLLDATVYQTAAERTLRAFAHDMHDHPAPFPTLLTALRERHVSPTLLILRGPDAELAEWKRAVDRIAPPSVLAFALPCDLAGLPASLQRPCALEMRAFVCSENVCLPEIVHLQDLLTILSTRAAA